MELSDQVAEDIPKYGNLLHQIDESLDQISGIVKKLNEQVLSGSLKNHNDGLDILKIKNECMGFYLADLLNVAGCQISGVSIADSPLVNRLIEQRVILERVRPLEEKLNYKIDKLTKMATDSLDQNDPIKAKPNLENLDLGSDSGEDSDEAGETAKTGKYVAPRVISVPYYESTQDREEKEAEFAKKRATKSSVIRELRADGDEPEEEETRILYQHGKISAKAVAAEKHRQKFEDENFVRVNVDKKDRHKERDAMRHNEYNNLTHFGDMSALYGRKTGETAKKRTKKQNPTKFGKKRKR